MPELSPELLSAYFQSRYAVQCAEGPACFRIGDEILPPCLRRPFALITAWNPRSQPLDREANDARQRLLLEQLAARGWSHLPARGEGRDGWREESAAVFGLRLDEALELARVFGQHAIVWGDGARAWLYLSSGERVEQGTCSESGQ
ncbi:DUF3293 domain-containing protein [Thermithiobacillus tepidarius DSM 3134]|uniref:DUF3293 domain-containing protein n=1 Tax=Thermithiobacillus tepidarius TaxID=929 RepID=UPI0003FD27BE|nr:DUF3293 domain-containing protein [Thermithiobacillus tepidarius]